jgi:hypothetical protein
LARPTQVALVVAVVVASATAHAEDAVTRADLLFKDGRRAAERGDYAQACKLFDQSFSLDPAVGTLVNLGDCAEHLGDLERAYGYYQTAEARMAEGDDRLPRVKSRLENIDEHAAKVALRLDTSAPASTVITVDGLAAATHERPIHLAAGAHVILVTAVNHRGTRYAIQVTEGEIRAVEVSPGPELDAVLPTAGGAGATRTRPSWMKPTGIAVLGVGLGTVWLASLAGIVAIDRRDVQNANCTPSGCNAMGVDAASTGNAWAAASTATFIVGGALLAAGIVLLTLGWSKHTAHTATVAVLPKGLSVAGSF